MADALHSELKFTLMDSGDAVAHLTDAQANNFDRVLKNLHTPKELDAVTTLTGTKDIIFNKDEKTLAMNIGRISALDTQSVTNHLKGINEALMKTHLTPHDAANYAIIIDDNKSHKLEFTVQTSSIQVPGRNGSQSKMALASLTHEQTENLSKVLKSPTNPHGKEAAELFGTNAVIFDEGRKAIVMDLKLMSSGDIKKLRSHLPEVDAALVHGKTLVAMDAHPDMKDVVAKLRMAMDGKTSPSAPAGKTPDLKVEKGGIAG